MTKVVRPLSCRSRQSNTNPFQPKTAQLPNCPAANCPIAQLPNCLTVFQPDLGVTHSTFTHSHRSSQRYKTLEVCFPSSPSCLPEFYRFSSLVGLSFARPLHHGHGARLAKPRKCGKSCVSLKPMPAMPGSTHLQSRKWTESIQRQEWPISQEQLVSPPPIRSIIIGKPLRCMALTNDAG
jgi:hypothetical protein